MIEKNDGRFQKGNQLWKLADPECLGKPRNFKTPTELWDKVKPYFEYCDSNPIETYESTIGSKGDYEKTIQHKIPYTWEGLYVFLGVCNLHRYKERPEFVDILTHIGNTIRNQKYSGAAAGIFNANIIARDLGLADKQKIEKEITDLSPEDREQMINALLEKAAQGKK